MFGFNKKKTLNIKISSGGADFSAPAQNSILQSALDAGLPYPHNCRVGTCTNCKTRLISGKVKELTDSAFVLEKEDLEQGYFLACQSLPRTDLELDVEIDESLLAPDTLSGMIVDSKRLTHDILQLSVQADKPPLFRAGQYVDVYVPGIKEPRSYSFASRSREDGLLYFFIRAVPEGEMSGWFHEQPRTGTPLKLKGPFGNFHLRESSEPIIAVAGGSGLAPLMAIMEEALHQKVERDLTLFFGARTSSDLYGLDEIKNIQDQWKGNFTFVPVLSEEPLDNDWKGARGLVTESLKTSLLQGLQGQAYLCGPPGMIDAATSLLQENGVSHIYSDKFLDRSHLQTPASAT